MNGPFTFRETPLSGCIEIASVLQRDVRGHFVKTLHKDHFQAQGIRWSYAEQYYSVSRRGTLRGMHFQLPPHDHDKLVYCAAGSILDVALDLRVGSPSYRQAMGIELTADNGRLLFIPAGLAHGFYALTDDAIVVYNVSSVYAPEHDAGVLWSSFGFAWPDSQPIISDRDTHHPALQDFTSPFHYSNPPKL